METPNREPQEYSRNITECDDPSGYFPTIFLLYSWGYLFGVPNNVPLQSDPQRLGPQVSSDLFLC